MSIRSKHAAFAKIHCQIRCQHQINPAGYGKFSLAALQAIQEINLDAPQKEQSELRARLLTYVVQGVEGYKVAELLIEQRLTEAADENKAGLLLALKYLQN